MNDFSQQWTEKTFINGDSVKLQIRRDAEDCDALIIIIEGSEFWLPKSNARDVGECLIDMSGS